ncbi:hypothetical protein ACHAPK_009116 [Fusarium culmorum]
MSSNEDPVLQGPVLVPIQLDAFVLNSAVCGDGKVENKDSLIAPITQPNYTFLRLRDFLIQSDVQNHVDLHAAAPASMNTRMTDFGGPSPKLMNSRCGVYLHWTLPRYYRIAPKSTVAATAPATDSDKSAPKPQPPSKDMIQPPTRWLVVRKLNLETLAPTPPEGAFQEYSAWVIESDHQWVLSDIPLDFDLQTDVSPFVVGAKDGTKADIEEQAEVFIGRKTTLEDWGKVSGEGRSGDSPNISLLLSGNQLFADFQMHNSNVFSMLDNFQYMDNEKKVSYLSHAEASYYLIGWHYDESVDPFWNTSSIKHQDILDSLSMNLQPFAKHPNSRTTWLSDTSPSRLVCHGAMYNVKYDFEKKPGELLGKLTPADEFSRTLRNQKLPAVSVGTTPMDALISYCTSRRSDKTKLESGKTPEDTVKKLEEDILSLYSLLHTRDDGVEGQREAKDTIYNWNFHRSPGGTYFHLSAEDDGKGVGGVAAKDGNVKEPDPETKLALWTLNHQQTQLDTVKRLIAQRQWDLFSLWWKYVSDATSLDNSDVAKDKAAKSKEKVTPLVAQISALKVVMDALQTDTTTGLKDPLLKLAKTGASPFFYRSRDPTILVGGIESGWSIDFVEKVNVRLAAQVLQPEDYGASVPDSDRLVSFQQLMSASLSKESKDVSFVMDTLLNEFYTLESRFDTTDAPNGKAYPQFHDKKTPHRDSEGTSKQWRDDWGDKQPWFPLFAEWEVEYTHIPFEHWTLDDQTARLCANPMARYGVSLYKPGDKDKATQVPLWEQLPAKPDQRVLSGRVLILPQPSFSLQAKVAQLFSSTPEVIFYTEETDPEKQKALEAEKRKWILDNLSQLSYLSAPLSGMTDGILTLSQGSHVKPLNKSLDQKGDETLDTIKAALFDEAGFTADTVPLIEGQSALTPYAKMVNLVNNNFCPFKPVTHGQMRFRKFNIVDKFGQSLAAIDPIPRLTNPSSLYPSISDFYEPQVIKQNDEVYANTIQKAKEGQCEYIQVPPQINQNVRLNAEFVVRSADDDPDMYSDLEGATRAPWRPASEWENPVWGWLIVNYADYGIQFFLPDGTFYREVRFGGPLGASVQPKWIPFARDPKLPENSKSYAQMDALIKELADPKYLERFWHMITTAQDNLAATPSAYAQFLNSIVGRPVALVNMGWSLELDGPPLDCQADTQNPFPERYLTKNDAQPKAPVYEFQVRLGDRDSQYDGLVGYFDLSSPSTPDSAYKELDLTHINTFFALAETKPGDEKKVPLGLPLSMLTTDTYPRFKPHYISPVRPADQNSPAPRKTPGYYQNERNNKLQVYGALIDPFTGVHGYSSFLPPQALQLPPWTWQQAMNSMTAFFHAGPLNLAINDLPGYDKDRELTQTNWRDVPPISLGLPPLGAGEWNWLQPYVRPKPKVPGPAPLPPAESLPMPVVVDESQPTFNSFAIDKRGDLTKPGFQKGPYVATEGYLQLRSPLTSKALQNPAPPGPSTGTGTSTAAEGSTAVTRRTVPQAA